MIPTRLWVLSTLPFALAACGDRDADDAAGAPGADTGFVTAPAPMPAPGTDAGVTGSTVAMNPVGGSAIAGQMEVMAHGDQTMVDVTLNGPADASSTHSGHIHQGSCDNPGPVVAPLQDVTLSGGTGTASSMAAVAPSEAMDGQHIVAYHAGTGDNPGAPVVCGAIPAQTGTTM